MSKGKKCAHCRAKLVTVRIMTGFMEYRVETYCPRCQKRPTGQLSGKRK